MSYHTVGGRGFIAKLRLEVMGNVSHSDEGPAERTGVGLLTNVGLI